MSGESKMNQTIVNGVIQTLTIGERSNLDFFLISNRVLIFFRGSNRVLNDQHIKVEI